MMIETSSVTFSPGRDEMNMYDGLRDLPAGVVSDEAGLAIAKQIFLPPGDAYRRPTRRIGRAASASPRLPPLRRAPPFRSRRAPRARRGRPRSGPPRAWASYASWVRPPGRARPGRSRARGPANPAGQARAGQRPRQPGDQGKAGLIERCASGLAKKAPSSQAAPSTFLPHFLRVGNGISKIRQMQPPESLGKNGGKAADGAPMPVSIGRFRPPPTSTAGVFCGYEFRAPSRMAPRDPHHESNPLHPLSADPTNSSSPTSPRPPRDRTRPSCASRPRR